MSDAPPQDASQPAGDAPAPGGTERFPWPPAPHESPVTALAETWRRSVFAPRAFFRALPGADTGAAVLYYLVIGITAAALQLFWEAILPASDAWWLGIPDPAARLSPLINFLLSPLYLLGSLLLTAGVTHLLVLALVPQQLGFTTTVRVFAYAYGPALLAIVPRVGMFLGLAWMIVLAVIGLREAHRTSTGRAATAVIVPLVVALVVVVVGALLIAAGALLLAR